MIENIIVVHLSPLFHRYFKSIHISNRFENSSKLYFQQEQLQRFTQELGKMSFVVHYKSHT